MISVRHWFGGLGLPKSSIQLKLVTWAVLDTVGMIVAIMIQSQTGPYETVVHSKDLQVRLGEGIFQSPYYVVRTRV